MRLNVGSKVSGDTILECGYKHLLGTPLRPYIVTESGAFALPEGFNFENVSEEHQKALDAAVKRWRGRMALGAA